MVDARNQLLTVLRNKKISDQKLTEILGSLLREGIEYEFFFLWSCLNHLYEITSGMELNSKVIGTSMLLSNDFNQFKSKEISVQRARHFLYIFWQELIEIENKIFKLNKTEQPSLSVEEQEYSDEMKRLKNSIPDYTDEDDIVSGNF